MELGELDARTYAEDATIGGKGSLEKRTQGTIAKVNRVVTSFYVSIIFVIEKVFRASFVGLGRIGCGWEPVGWWGYAEGSRKRSGWRDFNR